MTFSHCHQLYQGFIKYRLCAILVLTCLRFVAWEVCIGVGKAQRGSQVEYDKAREMSKLTQKMTLRENLAGPCYMGKERKMEGLFLVP